MFFASINSVEQPKNMWTIDTNTKAKMALAELRNNDDALGYTLKLSSGNTPTCFTFFLLLLLSRFTLWTFATFLIIFAVAIAYASAFIYLMSFSCANFISSSRWQNPNSTLAPALALTLLLLKRQMIVSVICFYFVAFQAVNRPYASDEQKIKEKKKKKEEEEMAIEMKWNDVGF